MYRFRYLMGMAALGIAAGRASAQGAHWSGAVPLLANVLGADDPAAEPAAGALARMKVKELTVFKDGHTFVLHEGKLPTDAAGNVVLDSLPTPVIGTFWTYVTDKPVKLVGTTAGRRRVMVERTSVALRDLLDSNPGAEVIVTERPQGREKPITYPATILGVPTRTSKEMEATSAPGTREPPAQPGNIILLKTADGTKVLPIDAIADVVFKGNFKPKVAQEEFRNLLTMRLDWGDAKPKPQVGVGMVYLQKGVRWIPEYRISIDGKGKATVKLQATVLNELADLENVTAHLAIGVPTFAFQQTIDPIALGQTVAHLTQFFQAEGQGQYAYANFSNSIMSQQAGFNNDARGPRVPAEAVPGGFGPEPPEAAKNEDLFLFTVKGITMKRGERMVVPISEFTIPYRDVYSLELSYAPPPEMCAGLNHQQQMEIAKLRRTPKVNHRLRLTNTTKTPLTTAPAIIERDGKVLAQGMTTFTSAGSASDITVTTAVDVKATKVEKETARLPNALQLNNSQFQRVDLAGTITVTNYRDQPVELEIVRLVLGKAESADRDGTVEMINWMEDDVTSTPALPVWWSSYSWPHWWHRINGVGKVRWTAKLEPGKSTELKYTWHYFWQ